MGCKWITAEWRISFTCTQIIRPVCTENRLLQLWLHKSTVSRDTHWQICLPPVPIVCRYLSNQAKVPSKRIQTLIFLEISGPLSPHRIWCPPDHHHCPQKTVLPSLPKARAVKSWKILTNVCIESKLVCSGGSVFKMSGLVEFDQETLVPQGVLRNLLLSLEIAICIINIGSYEEAHLKLFGA